MSLVPATMETMMKVRKYFVMAVRPVPLSCPVMTNPEYMDSIMPVGDAVEDHRGDIKITLYRAIDNTEIFLHPDKRNA
jgi:hypothetical protein